MVNPEDIQIEMIKRSQVPNDSIEIGKMLEPKLKNLKKGDVIKITGIGRGIIRQAIKTLNLDEDKKYTVRRPRLEINKEDAVFIILKEGVGW